MFTTQNLAKRMITGIGLSLVWLSGGLALYAQPLAEQQITISAAAEPVPSLKYELRPTYFQRQSRDASNHYYRALLLLSQRQDELVQAYVERGEAWNAAPKETAEWKEMQSWLENHETILTEVRRAAYSDHCDWQLRLKDLRGTEALNVLLNDFQAMRSVSRVIQVQVRYDRSVGDFDDAIESLKVGYQAGSDTAKAPSLICALIGGAIIGMMNHEVMEMIQQPECPNLYWALSGLPRPMLSLRQALDQEAVLPLQLFPFLSPSETEDWNDDQWRESFVQAWANIANLQRGNQQKADLTQARLAAAAVVMRGYPVAKRGLIEDGYDEQEVEEMSPPKAVGLYTRSIYRRLYDDQFKWLRISQAERSRFKGDRIAALNRAKMAQAEVLPIVSMLLPALNAVEQVGLRLDRDVAVLRTIEALRMHASTNEGSLPSTLEEIRVVPVPVDPATGRPFTYEVKEGIAKLTREHVGNDGKLYIIQVR